MKSILLRQATMGVLGALLLFASFAPRAAAQSVGFANVTGTTATLKVGCTYTFVANIQAAQDQYGQDFDFVVYYWNVNSSGGITNNCTVDFSTSARSGNFNAGTPGDGHITLRPVGAFQATTTASTRIQVFFDAYVYDASGVNYSLVRSGDATLNLAAVFEPVAGAVRAPTTICPNTPFSLSYTGSRAIQNVNWYESSTSGPGAIWYPLLSANVDEGGQFKTDVSGIAQTTYYKAEVVTPNCGMATPTIADQEFAVTVAPTTGLAGQVYGAREVGIGSNEGTLTLADCFGTIQKWQQSQDNGTSWQDINQTVETLAYENLTRTTVFRAQVLQCGITKLSGTCTVTVQDLNWVDHASYDVDGGSVMVGRTRTYSDSQGKTLQTQAVNISDNMIMASQPLYGQHGQIVGNTLLAPINKLTFEYVPSFVAPASAPTAPYDYSRFDAASTRNAPEAVAASTTGTLGWYYSANNTLEPYTPTTSYPYARTDAEPDGSTGVTRTTLPGDVFRLGQGKESIAGHFGIGKELDTYLALRSQYFTTAELGSAVTTLNSAATQQVSMDANGQKSIAVVDKEGHTVMTMRPGEPGKTWLTVDNTVSVGWRYNILIPTCYGTSAAQINAPSDVMLYDGSSQWVYTGPANLIPSTVRASMSGYSIYCNSSFTITGLTPGIPCTNIGEIASDENTSKEFYNFYTLAPTTTLTITPELTATGATDYDLINTATGALVPQSSIANLPAGFYQIRIKKGQLTMSWRNTYQDISFGFYNQKGLLVGNLTPNGAKLVIDDYAAGLSAYTRATLPFFTSYEYDQQGRLLALNDPDAGRTEYIYRADGKLRFSQNAKQRNSDDHVFSYVGYDELGRAIESGECLPNNYWYFRDYAHTSAVLEAVGGSGLPGTYDCYDVVKSTYDMSVPLPSMAGTYTQSFLPGRVSNTAKYLEWSVNGTKTLQCSTWFSYDDQGRTQWQVQQTTGQPARSVEYAYDFLGNVTWVCYQKNVPSERLTHYYQYNDDRKLIRVYTGQDVPDPAAYGQHVEQAAYTYYLHGPLKRIVFGHDLQGVDYTYTAQGWLKGINDGDLARDPGRDGSVNTYLPDLFGTTLNYYTGDYASRSVASTNFTSPYPARYDGTVRGSMWQTPGSPLHAYGYYYDKKGQLVEGMYGRLTSSASRQYHFSPFFAASGAPFYEGDISYDPNGNIGNIWRTNETGAVSLGVTYNYLPNTNKLAAVKNGNTPVISYDYDELGQMTGQREAAPGKTQYLDYDASGKVTGIYRDAAHLQLAASYSYDEFGRRVQQRVYPNASAPSVYTTTTFVRDAAGNELASYVNTSGVGLHRLYEQPIYGATRIGIYRHERGNEPAEQLYELNDQLGNTRVVFHRPQTETYTLSMEEDYRDIELESLASEAEKQRYEDVRTTSYSRHFNPDGSPNVYGSDWSIGLGPVSGFDTGPVRELVVQRGDHVHMEAWAAYPDDNGDVQGRGTLLIAGAAATGAKATFATPTDGKQPAAPLPVWQQLLGKLSLGMALPLASKSNRAQQASASSNLPQATLQYVLRRQRDNAFLRNGTAYVSANAEGQWEKLALDIDITETEASVLEISVQNYDAGALNVYFDDVKVEYTDGPVIQENHFYAYGQRILGGATDFMSWERIGRRKYRHGYQGLYATVDEESGYDGFELRLYDSRIGRWLSTDPMGQYHSPFIGMGNNPANGIDPNGGWLFGLFGSTSKQREAASKFASAHEGTVADYYKSSIHVNWGDAEASHATRFTANGTPGSIGSATHDLVLDNIAQQIWRSGFHPDPGVADPSFLIESLFLPLPKGVGSLSSGGVRIASGLGEGTASMVIVETIERGTTLEALSYSMRLKTYMTGVEHAAVKLTDGSRVIVSGGESGIILDKSVNILYGHTHPTAAPASLADHTALTQLGQTRQYVILPGGETILVRPK